MTFSFKRYLPKVLFFTALSTLGTLSFGAQNVEKVDNDLVWISIGKDAVNLINQKHSSTITMNVSNKITPEDDNIAVVSIYNSQIDNLSKLMHEEFKRCGGFIYHDTYEQAKLYAETTSNFSHNTLVDYTIDNATGVNALVNQISASNLSSTVNSLSNFNNRYYRSQTGVDSANWIKNRWAAISRSRSDINVELFNHSWQQPSVIATITGTTRPDEIVIIGGHLDSINSRRPTNGRAPGSDDNASGIAIATETLRAMVASGFKPERTVKLMGYAAEEVGLRGSKAIARQFRNQGQNVVGVTQYDMSGYKGNSNLDIVFISDYTNSAQNQFMTQLLDTYFSNVRYTSSRCGYACSDHASWHNEGYAASMPFESRMNNSNRTIHSANDTSYNANHALNFLKLSVAYVAELAKGGTGR